MFFLENINVPFAEYRRKLVAEVKGVTAVTEPDRPFLQQYLNGEIDTCSQIDHSLVQNVAAIPSTAVDNTATKPSKGKDDRVKQKHERYIRFSNWNKYVLTFFINEVMIRLKKVVKNPKGSTNESTNTCPSMKLVLWTKPAFTRTSPF